MNKSTKAGWQASAGFFALLVAVGVVFLLLAPWGITKWYLALAGVAIAVSLAQALAGTLWELKHRRAKQERPGVDLSGLAKIVTFRDER